MTIGAFAFGTTGQTSAQKWQPIRSGPGTVVPAGFVQNANTPAGQLGR